MPAKIMALDNACRGHGPLLQQNEPGNRALRRGRVSIPHQVYLVTAATSQRQGIFHNFQAGCAAARCFEDTAILGDARMLAWVLMPDHAHWLIQLGEKDALGLVVNRIKSASARLANRVFGRRGALWQPAYHEHALRSEEDVRAVSRYIVANPLRAQLVQQIGDYPFWNAIWI